MPITAGRPRTLPQRANDDSSGDEVWVPQHLALGGCTVANTKDARQETKNSMHRAGEVFPLLLGLLSGKRREHAPSPASPQII